MFRVPQDTVLRRVAATSLLVLTTSLAACGGSDGEQKSAKASTPKKEAPVPTTSVTDTEEGAGAIGKANTDELSPKVLNNKIDAITAALNKAGLQASSSPAKSDATGSVQIGQIAIVFYTSAKDAAVAGAQFVQLLANSGGHGRVARSNERLYLMNIPNTTASAADKAKFKKVRTVADAAL